MTVHEEASDIWEIAFAKHLTAIIETHSDMKDGVNNLSEAFKRAKIHTLIEMQAILDQYELMELDTEMLEQYQILKLAKQIGDEL